MYEIRQKADSLRLTLCDELQTRGKNLTATDKLLLKISAAVLALMTGALFSKTIKKLAWLLSVVAVLCAIPAVLSMFFTADNE